MGCASLTHPTADHYEFDPNKPDNQSQLSRPYLRPFGHKNTIRFLGDKGAAHGYGWQEFNLLRKAA